MERVIPVAPWTILDLSREEKKKLKMKKMKKWRVNKKWTDNHAFGPNGASKISEYLKINTTITRLDLMGNEIWKTKEKKEE